MNSDLLEKFQASRKPKVSQRFKYLSVGWRTIAGRRMFFRSRWEANYAFYLQHLLEAGEIKDWEHEPTRFKFKLPCGNRSYTPDFRVHEKSGREVFCEVKGFKDWRSLRKLKWMKRFYTEVVILIADSKWFARNTRKLKGIVTGWEI